MPIIKCSCCGSRVSDMAYVCPYCGFDVVALKASGHGCRDCTTTYTDEEHCDLGPAGYPCLAWDEWDWGDD